MALGTQHRTAVHNGTWHTRTAVHNGTWHTTQELLCIMALGTQHKDCLVFTAQNGTAWEFTASDINLMTQKINPLRLKTVCD
jgi:hypothetical protein